MFIKKIRIKNFKLIEEMPIEFSEGINLIIGDNGTGKTSILEAIVVALGAYLSGIKGATTRGIRQNEVRYELKNLGGITNTPKYFSPTIIECVADFDGEEYSWTRYREDESGKSKTKTSNHKITKHAMEVANNEKITLPVMSYRSAEFGVSQFKRKYTDSAKSKIGDRRCGYVGCMNSLMDYGFILEWCQGMSEEEFYQERKIPLYEAFKNSVASMLQIIDESDEKKRIRFNKFFKEMVLEENGVTLPISSLSAGYKAVLYLVMDIAFRMALLNPHVSDFKNVPGIVLIDELDMHLHPKWQWNILNALHKTFPKIQFIIATHSPICLSACKDVKRILINQQQKVVYLGDSFAYSVDDILYYLQGSQEIPKRLKKLVNDFDMAINAENIDGAKQILEEMKQFYGDDNSQVKLAKQELEFWV